jgi:hypothetical protein
MKLSVAVSFLVACTSSGTSSVDLPLITPPVRAAAPAGFGGTSARRAGQIAPLDATLSPDDIKSRFFSPGPTEVFQILQSVDDRISEVNSATTPAACLEQAPVSYPLHVFGQDVAFEAQCYRTFTGASGPPAFMQFGSDAGTTYLYVTGGAARLAARIAGDTVDVWYGVGYTNDMCGGGTWDGCSYGVTQIEAQPDAHAFEMTVSGIGVGYCGVQLRSDGSVIYGEGSPDMGATCAAVASLCANASDLSAATACDAVSTFALPPLGREAGSGAQPFGASQYPADPTIVLDGTPSDSLGFGPGSAPTDGVGNFDQ